MDKVPGWPLLTAADLFLSCLREDVWCLFSVRSWLPAEFCAFCCRLSFTAVLPLTRPLVLDAELTQVVGVSCWTTELPHMGCCNRLLSF